MASWFSSLAEQAFKLADDLADSIVTQANQAQAEMQEEQQKLKSQETLRQERLQSSNVLLPWETSIESRQILIQDLMERILSLSLNELNFTTRPPNANDVYFSIQDFVPVAMRLLEIDSNLGRLHAKLSPRMNEETLWFNYYCRVVYLRACSGIDGIDAQTAVSKWKESDIIAASQLGVANATASVALNSTNRQAAPSTPTASRSSPQQQQQHRIATTGVATTMDTSLDTVIMATPSKISPIATPTAHREAVGIDADDHNIALDDLDDLELDDKLNDLDILDELDDLDPDEYENINASDLNEELEAQIALELAADL